MVRKRNLLLVLLVIKMKIDHLSLIKVDPPLFTNLLSNIKPITTKSRKHFPEDGKFMREHINELCKSGFIRPSVSPWRSQVFVIHET